MRAWPGKLNGWQGETMDPDKALEELRAMVQRISDSIEDASGNPSREQLPSVADLYRLTSAAQALDEWLSKGGFLPKAWGKRDNAHDARSAKLKKLHEDI